MSISRPFKIWSVDRKVRKSLVAKDLDEIKQKGRTKLNVTSDDVKVVVEEDGTQICDDEYLNEIDDHSVLLVLASNETWKPVHTLGQDETDSGAQAPPTLSQEVTSLQQLALVLRHDLTKLVLFTSTQLQCIVDSSASELSQLMGITLNEAHSIQAACQRHLDEKQEVREARQLLSMLSQDGEQSSPPGKKLRKS